jgi:peptidyl-prolyl cis-trans isomerase SurA
MYKYLQILGFCIFANIAIASQQSSVTAIVNGDAITDLDIAKRLKLITVTSGIPNNAQTLKIIKPQVIQMLVDERLINQEADKLGLEASEQEITASFMSLADKNSLSQPQFESFLKQKNIDKDVLKEQVKHQILWNEIITSKIKPGVTITAQEIEENESFIRKALKSEKEKILQVKLSEIVIFASEKTLEKQLQFAQKLVDDMKSGANFSKVAKEFSQSASASHGGEIGWVYVDQLSHDISDTLSKVPLGGISDPIVLQDGIHILKVLDIKKNTSLKDNEIDEDQVKLALMERKLNLNIRSYLTKLRRNAYIKINE